MTAVDVIRGGLEVVVVLLKPWRLSGQQDDGELCALVLVCGADCYATPG